MERRRGERRGLYNVLILIIFALLAAVVVGQVLARSEDEQENLSRQQALLQAYRQQAAGLQTQIAQVRTETEQLRAEYETALANLKEIDSDFYNLCRMYTQNVTNMRRLAGLSAVQGPGIIIKLDDSSTMENSIAHDTYLMEILNVLKTAGAQAIAVSGAHDRGSDVTSQRVLAMSEALCLGPSIRINGDRLMPPYWIYAIGDATALYQTFTTSPTYMTLLAAQLQIDIEQSDRLQIQSYDGNYKAKITMLF